MISFDDAVEIALRIAQTSSYPLERTCVEYRDGWLFRWGSPDDSEIPSPGGPDPFFVHRRSGEVERVLGFSRNPTDLRSRVELSIRSF